MGYRGELQKQIAQLQQKLDAIDDMPEDTYNLGTVALFSQLDKKWYLLKVAEEDWKPMSGGPSKELIEYIMQAKGNGYFEVYIMKPENNPIYSSE